MKNPIVVVLTLFTGIILGYIWAPGSSELDEFERANYETLPYKIELIDAYNKYLANAETLLDSIWKIDSYFEDVTVETDAYYEYELARERVLFLNSMEGNAELSWEDYKEFLKKYDLQPYQQDLKD